MYSDLHNWRMMILAQGSQSHDTARGNWMQQVLRQKPNRSVKKESCLLKWRKEKPPDFLVMKFVLGLQRGKAGKGDLSAEVALLAHGGRGELSALCVSGFNKRIKQRFL